jgi:MYXO-CTERM domain-containing protein
MKQWLVRRGLLASLPLAAVVALAVNACSSEPGGPGGQQTAKNEATEDSPQTDAVEVPRSANAALRLTRLTQQFVHVPVEVKQPAIRLPPGALPPRSLPDTKPPVVAPRPVLSKGEASQFIRQGSRLRAEVGSDVKRLLIKPASIELPSRSDGFVRVQPDGAALGVEFATKDAKPGVAVEVADGTASYPGAGPNGSDVILRVTGDSVEDFVVLQEKPATPFIDYTVKTEEVAGLRLYDNTLEFLDAGGDPQVRVKPPSVIDRDGVSHPASLSLQGCRADTSGLAPWGRPVTAPGAAQCTVRVSWTDTNVTYPAIVDPVWATAGSLATERWKNSAVRLSTGLVLTCGGEDKNGVALKSCETFNPAAASGAGAWSATTSMGTGRKNFSLLSLVPASTDVVAVGGDVTVFTSERFNGSTWTASTGDFSAGYFQPQAIAAVTSDGAYVVVIDYDDTPFRLPTATNIWNTGTTNPAPIHAARYNATLLGVPGQGTIMRVGGYYSGNFTDAERYKPSTDSWSTPGNATPLTVARYSPAFAVLDANRVMVYGGYAGSSIGSGEIYNVATNTWSFTTDPLPAGYAAIAGLGSSSYAFHGSGKMLSATDGGLYLYDPLAPSTPWTVMNTYNQGFYSMGSGGNIVSAGSKVLMVPVQPNGNNSGVQTACRLFDFGDRGSICSSTVECQAGLQCVNEPFDGVSVCCDTACSGTCSSCRAAHKQSNAGEGTCGGRRTDDYVGYTVCPSTDSTTCGTTGGYCDGVGGCMKWSNTTTCAYQGCADSDTQNNERKCDGKGNCAALTSTDCATGYQCTFNACVNYCYDDSYCSSTYYCQYWSNPAATYTKCQPKKANGAVCANSNAECSSGFCIDGVCCDKACNGTCEACNSALTGQTNGSCKPIPAGQSSSGECNDAGPANCGLNGLCNGAAGCQLYSSGTQCANVGACSGESTRYIPDTCNGTGTCIDKGIQACNAGYACVAGVCQTQCTTDSQCASNHWCDTVNAVCVADRDPGQSCSKDATCKGNANCVDGVCCDSACTGTCRSCLKNRTGLAADGVCGNTTDDTDPENECATDVGYPASCKAPGTCDGQGACRVYAKTGIVAKANVCSSVTLTTTSCDGAGNLDPHDLPCYPYKCNAAGNACRVACTTGTAAQDCDDSSFCGDSGTCVGQKLNGSECRDNNECKSQHCANIGKEPKAVNMGAGGDGAGGAANDDDPSDAPGVCCDSDCGNPCEACKKSIKGEGTDGTCGPVKDHTDPAGDCGTDAANPCGHNGQCDGDRHCRNVPGGTACGATKCVGNSVQGQRCDGLGACINNDGTTACAPYVCRDISGAEQCTNPCAEDNDCADGYFCSEMACKKKLANGKLCATSAICNSGFCVDGLCCDVSCNGQCEACDSAGNEGVCSPVKGEPHGSRAKCDHAGEECGGQCDGVNSAACKYKPNGDTCGTTTCDNDLAKSSTCNGQGECKANKNTECSPYTCGTDDTCLERCEQDADCTQGYACDEITQRCLPSASAATCSEDRLTSQGQNGANTPCKPFLCVPASGTCAVSCAFTTDCSPDFVCEPSTKTCLPAPADNGGSDDTSCACRAAGAAPKSSGYLALAALGVALTGLRRRRRSRKPAHSSSKPRGLASVSQPSE